MSFVGIFQLFVSNIRSFAKNADSLVLTLRKENFDIIVLTESWLSKINEVAPLLGIISTEYSYIRCDRSYGKGGGILILLKSFISFKEVFSESFKKSYEILVTDLIFTSKEIRLIAVYQAPNCDASNSAQLFKALSDYCSCELPCILLGDFNFPEIKWNGIYPASKLSRDFLRFIGSHCFSQLVPVPTRGNSFLYLVFCKCVISGERCECK